MFALMGYSRALRWKESCGGRDGRHLCAARTGSSVSPSRHRGYRMNEAHDNSMNPGWSRIATALVVILVGALFLLRNFGVHLPFMALHNWWALFILLGAVPSLGVAAQRYQRTGQVDRLVLHALLSAACVILVASFFLLDLDWAMWWPLFVIYGGLWCLVGGNRRDRERT